MPYSVRGGLVDDSVALSPRGVADGSDPSGRRSAGTAVASSSPCGAGMAIDSRRFSRGTGTGSNPATLGGRLDAGPDRLETITLRYASAGRPRRHPSAPSAHQRPLPDHA